jgi:Zn-dependent peptidase ImmA (M78 family)
VWNFGLKNMKNSRQKSLSHRAYSDSKPRSPEFQGDLALGLWDRTPGGKDPVDSIVRNARALIRKADLEGPPYRPAAYAPLRKVKSISYKAMQIDGRLLPINGGFVIELKRGRSLGRENFTLAHEIAHTFFFELVGSIKYKRLNSLHPQDDEEEALCNIAASELLMPYHSIAGVAGDYAPSPVSLQRIAQLYETSLTATAVRLTSLSLWNARFILWEAAETGLRARWLAQPGRAIQRSPVIEIENDALSSVSATAVTGESSESHEWICFDRRFVFCKVSSIRLPGANRILSMIGPSIKSAAPRRTTTVDLPLDYDCRCNGTGTRLIERDGRVYAARCLASNHRQNETIGGVGSR